MKKATKKGGRKQNKNQKKPKEKTKTEASESNFKIQPIGDKVLIKTISPEELEKKSFSGIIIPDTVSKEKPEQGMVIAVGKGKYDEDTLIPMTVKVGDRVLFSKYGYDEVKVDDEEYYILSESSILAIIR